MLAGLSAAGLIASGQAQAQVKKKMHPAMTPAPGKNMHPLLAKRDQKAILARIQSLMKRDGYGALVIVKPENVLYATGYLSRFAYGPGVPAGS